MIDYIKENDLSTKIVKKKTIIYRSKGKDQDENEENFDILWEVIFY